MKVDLDVAEVLRTYETSSRPPSRLITCGPVRGGEQRGW
jgi:hypothetical protein